MKIYKSISEYRKWRDTLPKSQTVGFVPTMGALHAGHFSLVNAAQQDNPLTVVSIFVNPTQFGPKEDFKKYPRPWKADVAKLKKAGVDVLFSPSAKEMYPDGFTTTISVKGLNSVLCGAPTSRGSGHFDGVATVVSKLFNIVQPDRAYFGMKDFQQVRVLEQMVQDLNMKVEIVRCPTIREQSGLAMSSRNQYLNLGEKSVANQIYSALQYGRKLLTSKSRMAPGKIQSKVRHRLASIPNSRVEYFEMVDPVTLQPIRRQSRSVLLAVAIRLGKTRLIDNLLVNK